MQIMAQRKTIPTPLYTELSEYSSLIRSLRTNNTLDVVSHITNPPNKRSNLHVQNADEELNSDDDDDTEYEDENSDLETGHSENNDTHSEAQFDVPPSTSQSRDISPNSHRSSPFDSPSQHIGQKRKRRSTSPPEPRRRETWTRWPLLPGDVHVPEWSLEDEIALLATSALKKQRRPPLPADRTRGAQSTARPGDSDDDVEGDPGSYLPHVADAASNYLATILALLVAHTPNRPNSQQNRIEPIGWRAVLDILSSCGDSNIADQKVIDTVRSRMESVYGSPENVPSTETLAAHRIQRAISAKQKLQAKLSGPMNSLFSLADSPPGHSS